VCTIQGNNSEISLHAFSQLTDLSLQVKHAGAPQRRNLEKFVGTQAVGIFARFFRGVVISPGAREQQREACLLEQVAGVVAGNRIAAESNRNPLLLEPRKWRDTVTEFCI